MERLDTAVCSPVVAIETACVTRRQEDARVMNVPTASGDRAAS